MSKAMTVDQVMARPSIIITVSETDKTAIASDNILRPLHSRRQTMYNKTREACVRTQRRSIADYTQVH